tara:strand:+ start:170 stop:1435 length:1266 start_codon:yes stop_codon:yes gene_type:complete
MFHSKLLLLVLLLSSFIYSQGRMNGFGIGHLYQNQGIEAAHSGISYLVPSFQREVSLSNPSTWQNLKYTFLSISYAGNESHLNELKNTNGYSILSNASWILPIKSKYSFGVVLSPYADQRIELVAQDTLLFIAYGDSLQTLKSINRSGGLMSFKLGGSYKLTDRLSLGTTFNILFGSSRFSESINFNMTNSAIQSSRVKYNGFLNQLFLSYKPTKSSNFYFSFESTIKSLEGAFQKKPLFEDYDNNMYHDTYEFPNPDSLNLISEIKIKNLHSPSTYRFGMKKTFNMRSEFSLELKAFRDAYKKSGFTIIPLNNSINRSVSQNISYKRFPDDLSFNILDRFTTRIGLSSLKHFLENENASVTELGFLIGLGYKFKPIGNQLDLSFYYGRRSYTKYDDQELVRQVQLSTSIADLWFVKRRQK